MGGLMGQPLTNHQDPLFRYAVQVALAFRARPWRRCADIILSEIDRAPAGAATSSTPTVRPYLDEMFDVEASTRSRGEIMSRLYSLTLADPVFRRSSKRKKPRSILRKK